MQARVAQVYKMSRKQLVGTTGQKVQADGGREVLGGLVAIGANSGGHRVPGGGERRRGSGGGRSKQQ